MYTENWHFLENYITLILECNIIQKNYEHWKYAEKVTLFSFILNIS